MLVLAENVGFPEMLKSIVPGYHFTHVCDLYVYTIRYGHTNDSSGLILHQIEIKYIWLFPAQASLFV